MATASRIDIAWRQTHDAGCLSCDLCAPADASAPHAVQAVTARPASERPATGQPVLQVERQRLTVEDCDAVFGRELDVY